MGLNHRGPDPRGRQLLYSLRLSPTVCFVMHTLVHKLFSPTARTDRTLHAVAPKGTCHPRSCLPTVPTLPSTHTVLQVLMQLPGDNGHKALMPVITPRLTGHPNHPFSFSTRDQTGACPGRTHQQPILRPRTDPAPLPQGQGQWLLHVPILVCTLRAVRRLGEVRNDWWRM